MDTSGDFDGLSDGDGNEDFVGNGSRNGTLFNSDGDIDIDSDSARSGDNVDNLGGRGSDRRYSALGGDDIVGDLFGDIDVLVFPVDNRRWHNGDCLDHMTSGALERVVVSPNSRGLENGSDFSQLSGHHAKLSSWCRA